MNTETETVRDFDSHIFSIKVKPKSRKRVSRHRIMQQIACPALSLAKCSYSCRDAYFIFEYDTHPHLSGENRPEYALWDTMSVYVAQLNHMSEEQWVAEGKAFVDAIEATGRSEAEQEQAQ